VPKRRSRGKMKDFAILTLKFANWRTDLNKYQGLRVRARGKKEQKGHARTSEGFQGAGKGSRSRQRKILTLECRRNKQRGGNRKAIPNNGDFQHSGRQKKRR